MRRPYTTHYLFGLLVTAISLNSACSSCVNSVSVPGQDPAPPAQTITGPLPFSTKEPPVYQAEIVITVPGDGSTAEQKYFTARDGEKRRTDHQLSAKTTFSVLETADGRAFVLLPAKKCAAEGKFSAGNTGVTNESFTDFLTNEWLAEKSPASYESLGREEIGGVMLTKYRVHYDNVNGIDSVSEAMVWVDEKLGMPVRTESYSLPSGGSGSGGQKTDLVTIEFRSLKLSVEPDTFNKPEGCQTITGPEMQKILWLERLDAE